MYLEPPQRLAQLVDSFLLHYSVKFGMCNGSSSNSIRAEKYTAHAAYRHHVLLAHSSRSSRHSRSTVRPGPASFANRDHSTSLSNSLYHLTPTSLACLYNSNIIYPSLSFAHLPHQAPLALPSQCLRATRKTPSKHASRRLSKSVSLVRDSISLMKSWFCSHLPTHLISGSQPLRSASSHLKTASSIRSKRLSSCSELVFTLLPEESAPYPVVFRSKSIIFVAFTPSETLC